MNAISAEKVVLYRIGEIIPRVNAMHAEFYDSFGPWKEKSERRT